MEPPETTDSTMALLSSLPHHQMRTLQFLQYSVERFPVSLLAEGVQLTIVMRVGRLA